MDDRFPRHVSATPLGSSSTKETDPKRLAELVYLDDLTGLYNRRHLFPVLEGLLAGPSRTSPVAMVLADVDGFKDVNDSYGHLAGDQVLVGLAPILQRFAPAPGFAVRYAGDEFILVLPGTDSAAAMQVAERLRKAVEGIHLGASQVPSGMTITLSLGVVSAPQDGATAQALVESADRAMYSAKQQGRNTVSDAARVVLGKPRAKDLLEGFPCKQIVGRSTELARCESLTNFGERGPTTLGLLQGVGGIGKTRLLRDLARRRDAAGAMALWARCEPELRSVPYAPLLEMIRRQMARTPDLREELVRNLPEEHRLALAMRITELQSGEPAPLPDTDLRSRLFRGLLDLLRYLARTHRAHLFFDDLQYADPATLWVLSLLLERGPADAAHGIPIFASVGSDTAEAVAGPESAFGKFRSFIEGHRAATIVRLDPLDGAAVAEMVDHCLPRNDFPPALAVKVNSVAHGNPLVIEEVLTLLVLSGLVQPVGGGWQLHKQRPLTIPVNLSEILLAHMGQLDQETRDALLKASVIGPRFSLTMLHRVLEVNEGRGARVADRALEHRLLRDDGGRSLNELAFPNRRLQELTYEVVGEELKREIHKRVGGLSEELVVDLDEALARMADHYDRAGERQMGRAARTRGVEEAAKLYRESESDGYVALAGRVAAPRARAEIPEAVLPLPEEAVELLPSLMKTLETACRALQLYPAGSRYTEAALHDLMTCLMGILALAEAVTLKDREGVFEVNGRSLSMEAWGAHGTAVQRRLRNALVHSVTFNRALGIEDVRIFATALESIVAHGERADWAGLLARESVRGIGVVPKTYRATADREDAGAALEGVAQRAEELEPLMMRVVRYTAALIDAVRLYPRGSQTTKQATAGFLAGLDQAHQVVPCVNLGRTAEGFLVNDLRLDARGVGEAVATVCQLLENNAVSSLSFASGVAADPIEDVFRYLVEGKPPGDAARPWTERLAALGAHHVQVDAYVFVAADAQGGEAPSGSDPAAPERNDRSEFLRRILEGEPGDLLDPQVREVLPGVMTDLVLEGGEHVADIVGKVFLNLQAPQTQRHVEALTVFRETLQGTSRVVARELLAQACPHLAQHLRDERAAAPLAQLIELGLEASVDAVGRGDLKAAAKVMWQLGKELSSDPAIDANTRNLARRAVEQVMNHPDFNLLLTRLWTPSEKRKQLVLHLLESCGDAASGRLLELVLTADNEADRHNYALELKAVARPDWLASRSLDLAGPQAQESRLIHLLSVAERLLADPSSLLRYAFQHKSRNVQDAAEECLKRLVEEKRAPIIRALLETRDPTRLKRAIALCGELGRPELAPGLHPLLGEVGLPLPIRLEVCNALGHLHHPPTEQVLTEVLRSSWLDRVLNRAQPTELRVAAVWALRRFRTPTSLEMIRHLAMDKDPAVREAALLVTSTEPEPVDHLS
jgi:diguanylate cyclase (GGDEF)-like protein